MRPRLDGRPVRLPEPPHRQEGSPYDAADWIAPETVADAVSIEEAAMGVVVTTPIDVGRRAGDVVASAA